MYGNLAVKLPFDERKKLGARMTEKFRGDISRREPRMRRCKEIYKLFTLEAGPKSFPFQGCANVRLPLMTAPVIQHQSRLFDMLYADSGRIATVVSPSYYAAGAQSMSERYFNHYITHDMPEFAMGLDASTFQSVLIGSSFRRQLWDRVLARARAEWIPMEDFVAPIAYRSKDPSMSDLPRYSVVTRKSLRSLTADATLIDTDKLLPGTGADATGDRIGDISDRANSSDIDAPDAESPLIVVEYYFRYLAPNRHKTDDRFDGKEHPAYACFDLESETLLSLNYREEDDPADVERYATEYSQWRRANFMQQQASDAAASAGLVAPEPHKIIEPKIRQREVPLCTHYCAYPSEGFYGLGLGDFLLGPTKALNTITNQSLDAATVRIARPGFIQRGLRGARGPIASYPGQLTEVESTGDLRHSIFYPDLPPGDPFIGAVSNMIVSMSENVVGSYSTMAGQIPGSNQSAQGTLALIEQAQMPITVVAKRHRIAFSHELYNIWRLLGTFLPDAKMVDIIGQDATVENVKIGAHLFGPDSKVYPVADPRLKSERISDAQTRLGMATQNPIIQMGLQTGQPNAFKVMQSLTANAFRAMGDERSAILVEGIMPPPLPGSPAAQQAQGGPPNGPQRPPPGPPQQIGAPPQ